MTPDIFNEARRRVSRSLIEQYFAAPGAHWDGSEYWTLNPTRRDKKVGSFHISAEGQYFDHATKDGGDIIDLLVAIHGVTKKEAAEKIISDTGGTTPSQEKRQKIEREQQADRKGVKKEKPPAQIPIPEAERESLVRTLENDFFREKYGEFTAGYTYKTMAGDWAFVGARFERKQVDAEGREYIEKNVVPFYFTTTGKWKNALPPLPGKLPLYKIDEFGAMKKKTGARFLIVEGEKCAQVMVPGWIVVSWVGGTNKVHLSDFSPLADYPVAIWPDHDTQIDKETGLPLPDVEQPGIKAALSIREALPHAQIMDVRDRPGDGWDIADAAESMSPEELAAYVETCPRLFEEMPWEPYDAFRQFVADRYEDRNLEHIDGLFWEYKADAHCWREVMQTNIKTDILWWMEQKKIVKFLQNNAKAVHTFLKNTASHLEFYSTGYSGRNPFKESAIMPYIHFMNGAVEIKKTGVKFHERAQDNEDFFRRLYPVHCLDFDFHPEAYEGAPLSETAPAFHFYLRELIPPEDRRRSDYEEQLQLTIDFFSQIIAYAINPIKKEPYFFALYGAQRAGKSFFIDILEQLIGQQFFVKRPTSDMIGNRFATSDLWGAKVFVDDDVESNLKLPDAFIKNNSGNKGITVERKHMTPVHGVKISVAMFFLSNHNFKISGGAEGLARRFVYVPFDREIKNPDVYLLDKICGKEPKDFESGDAVGQTFDERPAIIGMALRGWELFRKNNYRFVMPDWIKRERDKWLMESSSVSQWFYEEFLDSYKSDRISRKEFYDQYKSWCDEEGRKAMGKIKFFEEARRTRRIKEIKGNMDRYVEILSDIDDTPSDEKLQEEIPF
ncbi:MAG: hypothetical protein CVV44_03985 [Spirochaetae bacterium HGW-Spirochaetae-1]|jgi:hypothetical protein|nr:MAG: hypothetical protein CVV44_03985 [Spirochaetae bacterium HGW-Spirochaetae-1]